MICSHDWRFIFLKTRKTAGTSVEIALSRFMGPLDIITPLMPTDEALRYSDSHNLARNYASLQIHVPEEIPEDLETYFYQTEQAPAIVSKMYNHITAGELKRIVGDRIWKQYFRFTIERDPFKRIESQYYWLTRKITEEEMPFSVWLRTSMPIQRANQLVYINNGALAVDFVIDFAKLNDDLALLAEVFGWPWSGDLPRAKSTFRKGRSIDWNDENIAYVKHFFKNEFQIYELAKKGYFRDKLMQMKGIFKAG